jgi:hypothetical protein
MRVQFGELRFSWDESKAAVNRRKHRVTRPMRSEYQLSHGRTNPYVARLGAKGRAELVDGWSTTTSNVRVLPDDVAREFPDAESTVEALRLVMKLRAVRPEPKPRRRRSAT